jgi:hypothetical protein
MSETIKPFTGITTANHVTSCVCPEELAAFVAAINEKYSTHNREAYPTCEANWSTLEHTGGAKYARIVSRQPKSTGGSAYCFVDLTNGNILKPASWKAPSTKHARGNIRVGNAANWFNGALTPYGCAYLR